ncbi:prepilin-type N-terminal cleavage/methylation domain-containing protein [Rhodocyclaceae bacterium SMB388]
MIGRVEVQPRGFTLIEVVVALSLLGMLLLAVTAAFRGLAQTSTRLERNALASEDMRVVTALLQRTVGMAVAHPGATAADRGMRIRFAGRPDALEWLAPLPAREGVGGLTHVGLQIGQHAGRAALMLHIAPYVNHDPLAAATGLTRPAMRGAEPDWQRLPPRPLIEGLTGFELRYRGVGESAWHTHWLDAEALPGHVMLSLQIDGRDWPPLVIALNAASPRRDAARTRAGQESLRLAGVAR